MPELHKVINSKPVAYDPFSHFIGEWWHQFCSLWDICH